MTQKQLFKTDALMLSLNFLGLYQGISNWKVIYQLVHKQVVEWKCIIICVVAIYHIILLWHLSDQNSSCKSSFDDPLAT